MAGSAAHIQEQEGPRYIHGVHNQRPGTNENLDDTGEGLDELFRTMGDLATDDVFVGTTVKGWDPYLGEVTVTAMMPLIEE